MAGPLQPRDARDRLIVALDVESPAEARRLVAELGPAATFYKLGMQLVFAGGLGLCAELAAAGKRVFLDMKLLDIDNTVAGAVESSARLGATFTTIHAYPRAMRAAVAARPGATPALLAVTVLTSMDQADLSEAGYAGTVEDLVAARAKDARSAGMDGVVCSPHEIRRVRASAGPRLLIVTPGIRPVGSQSDDQKRTMTAAAAIATGADYIVVGRPVTAAADPRGAAAAIVDEIRTACSEEAQ